MDGSKIESPPENSEIHFSPLSHIKSKKRKEKNEDENEGDKKERENEKKGMIKGKNNGQK